MSFGTLMRCRVVHKSMKLWPRGGKRRQQIVGQIVNIAPGEPF
jgi:hypothetical protein